jgi:23S rRNA pseudouridine2605 synthase
MTQLIIPSRRNRQLADHAIPHLYLVEKIKRVSLSRKVTILKNKITSGKRFQKDHIVMNKKEKKSFPPLKERLDAYLSRRGLGSRRKMAQAIKAGHVCVCETVITSPGHHVLPHDKITFQGKIVPWAIPEAKLFLYYKPQGFITSHSDPQGRPTVFEHLKPQLAMRHIISVGRLDFNSEGLLLLTTCGHLARTLELPHNEFTRTYHVRVQGRIHDTLFTQARKGLTLDQIHYRPMGIKILRQGKSNAWLEVQLYEGKNREIRRVMTHLNLRVGRLIRTAYGPFSLGELLPGQWRQEPVPKLLACQPHMP